MNEKRNKLTWKESANVVGWLATFGLGIRLGWEVGGLIKNFVWHRLDAIEEKKKQK